jgi:hypothetical protein
MHAGVVDLLVPCMDHGWCSGYTCQKRLSTFWTTSAMGHTHGINFTGTPARHLRLWQPYVAESDETVMHLDYFEQKRRYVWTPEAGRIEAQAAMPEIGDESGHGAFFWDHVRHLR